MEQNSHRVDDIVEALESYLPNADTGVVQRAYMYSAKVHAGQVRKSGEPYLTHPIEVAYLLTRLKLDEASIATGLLHDTVEDTLTTLEDLKGMFGNEIGTLVDGVTKLSQIKFDTDEHKQAENFRKMLVAMAKDIRVILVKLCDRLHNMQTLQFMSAAKQQRIAQETLDIYAPLANRLGINWIKSELEDLAFRYLHPQEYGVLRKRVDTWMVERKAYTHEVERGLLKELKSRGIECVVQGRPKHLYSIFRKMSARQIEFEQVNDVIAFRALVDTVGQCYEVLGHVHSIWHPIPGRFKDYIAMPKPNHYQSLHTSVVGPKGERIEIQIRTHEMHKVNEEGIAAHWRYKEKRKMGAKSNKEFAWLRQLLEWQQDLKDPNQFLDTVKYDLFTDEVFVFTPRGEVISLRRGATPVDFAFSIHTEIGLRCAGAKVNGRMVPLRYELKNGDMVHIITHPQQRPSKDWLSFVATSRARSKIRTFVQSEERSRSCDIGRDVLERELKRNGWSLQKLLKSGQLQQIAQDSRHHSVDNLLISIGYGRTTTAQIVEKISGGKALPPEESKLGQLFKRAARRRSTGGVVVQGIDDVLIRFGRCCNPLPGDRIIGFVTRGRGITVHRTDCTRGMDMDPARRIDVSWDNKGTVARPVSIRVISADRPGILATISQAFTDHGINISQANCKVTDRDRAINTFDVRIESAEQLRKVMDEIMALTGVVSVDRM